MQATNGDFYGTTDTGGTDQDGTLFKITSAGTPTTLYNFAGTDGANPYAGLVQSTNGEFYGTTYGGGSSKDGTIFRLSVGLGPFVETRPTSGKVGAAVIILGTNLTGATGVSFDGTAATPFTVVSKSEIKTTVPAGATTGKVQVTPLGGGTLSSNVAFRVTPSIQGFMPMSGPVGNLVTITGVSLTQTTKVLFGGVKATGFKVVDDSTVNVNVPMSGVTGEIEITTEGGTVKSGMSFTVTASCSNGQPLCASGACQTTHSNGVGQNFYDCNPLDTYSSATAIEAGTAYEQSIGGTGADVSDGWQCSSRPPASVCATNPAGTVVYYCWGYSSTEAGQVDSTGICPWQDNGTWN